MNRKIEKLDITFETNEREAKLRVPGFATASQEFEVIEDKINEIIDILNNRKDNK